MRFPITSSTASTGPPGNRVIELILEIKEARKDVIRLLGSTQEQTRGAESSKLKTNELTLKNCMLRRRFLLWHNILRDPCFPPNCMGVAISEMSISVVGAIIVVVTDQNHELGLPKV